MGLELRAKADWRDYLALTKPIVVILLLVTTLSAMFVALERWPGTALVSWTMIGGALAAGGASALNQYIDRGTDSLMQRTRRRPLPDGRLDAGQVLIFGILLCSIGLLVLATLVNLLSALLALSGILYYVLFYSLVLKSSTRRTSSLGVGWALSRHWLDGRRRQVS